MGHLARQESRRAAPVPTLSDNNWHSLVINRYFNRMLALAVNTPNPCLFIKASFPMAIPLSVAS